MGGIFLIRISDILQGGFHLETEWDISSIDEILDDKTRLFTVKSPLILEFALTLLGTKITLDGLFQIKVGLECVNCLKNFIFNLESNFRYLLWPESVKAIPEDKELHNDELEVSYYQGEYIDLRPLVREQIYLNLPMYPHCREDCKGLCQECGADLNETQCRCGSADKTATSPFSILKKLKDKT